MDVAPFMASLKDVECFGLRYKTRVYFLAVFHGPIHPRIAYQNADLSWIAAFFTAQSAAYAVDDRYMFGVFD